jgi:hypothetical protein
LTIANSGTGHSLRHPARIPFAAFMVAMLAYSAVGPNADQPFVNYAFASSVVFFVAVHAWLGEWITAVVLALGFALLHVVVAPTISSGNLSLSLYAGMLGRGGLAALACNTVWGSPEKNRQSFRISLLSLAIVLFVFASLVALNITATARLRVLDAYLYVFDSSLGFHPSFLLGRFFARHRFADQLMRASYMALPLVIASVCAGYLKYKLPWRPLAIIASAGMLGYLLYWIFPASGPLYVFGANFPGGPAELIRINLEPLVLPQRAPRNAIPSLHMAWALLLWFNSRSFSPLARALLAAYAVVTVAATLGTGEHYLVDLVVAFPFSLGVQALWTPIQAANRHIALLVGVISTFGWLLALRYGANFFLLSPAIPWACVVASTFVAVRLERRLPDLVFPSTST